ncbi:Spc19p SCDLUD_001880 [Saccharomycodes ludwigii]|uniref:Spc19p n=1 Tax=Saccharomycodes ludwigii TaxID=36035 RepID=UPI001E8381D4|nr:hypothetical protein SCDLUD_001880 [Saccharomycodes ludwigii]KAH3902069.1 hypothetical protein SCDLUD_001880 [Saccharomycodes ludwigii]
MSNYAQINEGINIELSKCLESLTATVTTLKNLETSIQNDKCFMAYKTHRVFQLLPEFDVHKAKLDAIETIDPLVNKIESKIEQALNRLERERITLQQTYELNKLRTNTNTKNNDPGSNNIANTVIMSSSTPQELAKLKELKAEREKLLKDLQDLNND